MRAIGHGAKLVWAAAGAGTIASVVYATDEWINGPFFFMLAVLPSAAPLLAQRSLFGFRLAAVISGAWLLLVSANGLLLFFFPSALLVLGAAVVGP